MKVMTTPTLNIQIESLNTDFIVPLEMKLNTEAKNANVSYTQFTEYWMCAM